MSDSNIPRPNKGVVALRIICGYGLHSGYSATAETVQRMMVAMTMSAVARHTPRSTGPRLHCLLSDICATSRIHVGGYHPVDGVQISCSVCFMKWPKTWLCNIQTHLYGNTNLAFCQIKSAPRAGFYLAHRQSIPGTGLALSGQAS